MRTIVFKGIFVIVIGEFRVGKDMYGVGYAGSRVCQGYGY
jgi:hypothetical protein